MIRGNFLTATPSVVVNNKTAWKASGEGTSVGAIVLSQGGAASSILGPLISEDC